MQCKENLFRKDPSDESASVLLERIRAEKKRLIQEGKIKREQARICHFTEGIILIMRS